MVARAIWIFRAHCIVIASLTPSRCQQRTNGFSVAVLVQPPCGVYQRPSGIRSRVVFNAVFNLLHKILQILLQLNRDVLCVKLALIRVAQDRRGAVIRRHNHKAVGRVEDMEGGITV